MDKEEWIDLFVRRRAGGQGLQNGLPHDPDRCCILHENNVSSRRLNLAFYSSFSECGVKCFGQGHYSSLCFKFLDIR